MLIKRFALVAAVFFVCASLAWADTVDGQLRYENRNYNQGGFTGATTYYPIRQADVEVIRNSDKAVLGTGQTDDNGNYTITIANSGNVEIFVRVYARQTDGIYNVIVRNNTSQNAVYVADTTPATEDTDNPVTVDADVDVSSGVAGPFNILDCVMFGFEYLDAFDPDYPASPQLLTVYWQTGTTNGTYFDRNDSAMFLLGQSSDPDEFDDDIILHEFGHYLEDAFADTDTPGGAHSLTELLDIRLSWSEGWAHYISAAIRSWVETNDPGRYTLFLWQIDNRNAGASSFNIEDPSFDTESITAANEIAVGAVLWDLVDAANEAHDTLDKTDTEVWIPFDDDIISASHISLEDYFDAFLADFPGDQSAIEDIFTDRTVLYLDDGNESNDTFSAGTPLTASVTDTQNTFFGVGDEDWFALSVESGNTYDIATDNLGDGADTVLYLYRSDGTTLVDSNDDRDAGGGDFGSVISFTANETGTWFARVDRYDGAQAVGTYGFYDFEFTQTATGTNQNPTVTVSASPTSGTGPLLVTFLMNAVDQDGQIVRYEIDFDGNGSYDASSASSGTFYHQYGRTGAFVVSVRVTDDDGDTGVDTVTVNVAAQANPPVISNLLGTASGSTAPVTVDFTSDITAGSGTVHSALWDFDDDGIVDWSSTTTEDASYIYRIPGTYTARLIIVDSNGAVVEDAVTNIVVNAGVEPPTASLSADDNAPLVGATVNFTATANDPTGGGSVGNFQWDFDGDGETDLVTSTGGPVAHRYSDVGSYTASVKVRDAAGLEVEATDTVDVASTTPAAILLTPYDGQELSGTRVPVTARVLPEGTSKSVEFQIRQDAADPNPNGWQTLGTAQSSDGVFFGTTVDPSAYADNSDFDLRVLVNGFTATGENDVTITMRTTGGSLDGQLNVNDIELVQVVDRDQSTRVALDNGAFLYIPAGSSLSSTDPEITAIVLDTSTRPVNGSAVGMAMIGNAHDFSVTAGDSSDFQIPLWIELPYDDVDQNGKIDGTGVRESSLEVHWFDTAFQQWRQDFGATVLSGENRVRVRTTHLTEFAIFGRASGGGGGGGGGGCMVHAGTSSDWTWLALIGLLIALRFGFRRI